MAAQRIFIPEARRKTPHALLSGIAGLSIHYGLMPAAELPYASTWHKVPTGTGCVAKQEGTPT